MILIGNDGVLSDGAAGSSKPAGPAGPRAKQDDAASGHEAASLRRVGGIGGVGWGVKQSQGEPDSVSHTE
jgi:hypothetical protein